MKKKSPKKQIIIGKGQEMAKKNEEKKQEGRKK